MSKTNYLEAKIIDHMTGKTSYTMPTVYVGLFTVAPGESTAGTECSGSAYARVATSGATWNAATQGAPSSTSNATAIAFPAATSNYSADVVAFGLFDASSGG